MRDLVALLRRKYTAAERRAWLERLEAMYERPATEEGYERECARTEGEMPDELMWTDEEYIEVSEERDALKKRVEELELGWPNAGSKETFDAWLKATDDAGVLYAEARLKTEKTRRVEHHTASLRALSGRQPKRAKSGKPVKS